ADLPPDLAGHPLDRRARRLPPLPRCPVPGGGRRRRRGERVRLHERLRLGRGSPRPARDGVDRADRLDTHPGLRSGRSAADLPGQHGAPVRPGARTVPAALPHADARASGLPRVLGDSRGSRSNADRMGNGPVGSGAHDAAGNGARAGVRGAGEWKTARRCPDPAGPVPAMVVLSLTAFAFAAVAAGLALVNGGWMWGAEGRLLEALKFDAALGIYLLTLGLLLPFAPWTARGRRRWIRWKAGLIVFSLGVENIQAWRGLDPRFSEIAGPVDQAIGGLFLIAAIGVMALFIVLLVSFARPGALPDHPGLRLALRYAAAGSLMGFGVGIAMSLIGGREVGAGGDLMLVHAAGFHALQAVPLV